ncbi:MAG: hypothetical protein HC782_00895 [Gammaproteobacteria bacterium]|nr:hypothetical protein [Gammaproteobacteria bacterium]
MTISSHALMVLFAMALASTNATFAKTLIATTTHTITISGEVSGKQVVTVLPGNKFKIEFSYRNNGRGPDIVEDITLDAQGQFSYFSATGKSTYGAPIEESFTRDATKSIWKSKADSGDALNSSANTANAIYVPVESSLEVAAMTVRALLRSTTKKIRRATQWPACHFRTCGGKREQRGNQESRHTL